MLVEHPPHVDHNLTHVGHSLHMLVTPSAATMYVHTSLRSVYKKGSIYLLDDPLSAVDPGIEHHIFDQCITDILDDCAVVLVTHQLSIARMTDHVIVMHKVRSPII